MCGSRHSGSTNAVALAMVTDRLSEAGVIVERVDVSPDFPAFQPEAVDDPPHTVRIVRQAFEQADGLVFAVPEYAGGMPGWVKNVTDWMVGSASMFERPVAVVSAATAGRARHRAVGADTDLAGRVRGVHVQYPGAAHDRSGRRRDRCRCVGARLHRTSDALLAVLRGEADAAALTAVTVPPLGIDPLDRLI